MLQLALLLALGTSPQSPAKASPPPHGSAAAEAIRPGRHIAGWVTAGPPVHDDAVGTEGLRIPIRSSFIPCADNSWRLAIEYAAVGVDLEAGVARFFRETGVNSAPSGDAIAWTYANTPHAYELRTVSVVSDDPAAWRAEWTLERRVEDFLRSVPPSDPPPKGWRHHGSHGGFPQENRRLWPDQITAEMLPAPIAHWLNAALPCDLPADRPWEDIRAALVASSALQILSGSTPTIASVSLMVSMPAFSLATHRSTYFWAVRATTSPVHHWLIRIDPCTLALIAIEPQP